MTDWPKGLGAPAARALGAAGFTDLSDLAGATERVLAGLHGMGPKALGTLKAGTDNVSRAVFVSLVAPLTSKLGETNLLLGEVARVQVGEVAQC